MNIKNLKSQPIQNDQKHLSDGQKDFRQGQRDPLKGQNDILVIVTVLVVKVTLQMASSTLSIQWPVRNKIDCPNDLDDEKLNISFSLFVWKEPRWTWIH